MLSKRVSFETISYVASEYRKARLLFIDTRTWKSIVSNGGTSELFFHAGEL